MSYWSQYKLNVYNLSAIKRAEAETLLLKTAGQLCVRFYRRADGTILTQNCPVGWRALKQYVSWWGQLALGMAQHPQGQRKPSRPPPHQPK